VDGGGGRLKHNRPDVCLADGEGETMERLLAGTLAVVSALGIPVTYIINVVDTWHGPLSPIFKIAINLTLDAFLAGIWPITWVLWGVEHLMGQPTPLQSVFG
jgi:hypothetical protein